MPDQVYQLNFYEFYHLLNPNDRVASADFFKFLSIILYKFIEIIFA